MLSLVQKTRLKSSKAFNYIFNTQVSAFLKEFAAQIEVVRFSAKFFASPTRSRHLGEMKTSFHHQFSEMVNGHFKISFEVKEILKIYLNLARQLDH